MNSQTSALQSQLIVHFHSTCRDWRSLIALWYLFFWHLVATNFTHKIMYLFVLVRSYVKRIFITMIIAVIVNIC